MKIKALVRNKSGSAFLIVKEYESMEMAQAELELEGYRVCSLQLSDENEYKITL